MLLETSNNLSIEQLQSCTHIRIRSPRFEASGLIHERGVREVGKLDLYLWKRNWLCGLYSR